MVAITNIIAAAALATTAFAAPGRRTSHQHHAKRGYDLTNINWDDALKNKDWSKVNFNGNAAAAPAAAAPAPVAPVAAAPAAPATPAAAAPVVAAAAAAAPVVALVTVTRVVAGKGTGAPVAAPVAAVVNSAVADNIVKAAVAPTLRTSTTQPPASAPTNPASGLLNMIPSGSEYAIQVVNNCAYDIWQAGWQTNKAGGIVDPRVLGNAMPAGSSINLAIPKSALGLQIWARTGCTGSGSGFNCAVGDCQGYQCSSIIWQKGPILAEFGSGLNTGMYDTDITAYDISAIPGNNVGCKIVPSISSCQTKYCPLGGCPLDQAWREDSDMHLGSPADTVCSNKSNFVVTFCPA
jgi:hypothetical protein